MLQKAISGIKCHEKLIPLSINFTHLLVLLENPLFIYSSLFIPNQFQDGGEKGDDKYYWFENLWDG